MLKTIFLWFPFSQISGWEDKPWQGRYLMIFNLRRLSNLCAYQAAFLSELQICCEGTQKLNNHKSSPRRLKDLASPPQDAFSSHL